MKQFCEHHIWKHRPLFQNNQCKTRETIFYIPGQSILPSLRHQPNHHSDIHNNRYKNLLSIFPLRLLFPSFFPFYSFCDIPSFSFNFFLTRNFLRSSFSILFWSFSLSLSSIFLITSSAVRQRADVILQYFLLVDNVISFSNEGTFKRLERTSPDAHGTVQSTDVDVRSDSASISTSMNSWSDALYSLGLQSTSWVGKWETVDGPNTSSGITEGLIGENPVAQKALATLLRIMQTLW